MNKPAELDLAVDGGTLRVLRFGAGPRVAVAVHGITASGMSYSGVARRLSEDWSLYAVDLRGRGGSRDTPGPYGMERHAADVCAVAEQVGGGAQVVLTGQSMGAYVALRAAVRRPELFSRLLMIDGGLPLPVPEGADPDVVLDATLGPAIARLAMTYPDDGAYVDFFRAHPALGPYWSEDIEAYVRYDLMGPAGERRSRAREEAARTDGRELLTEQGEFTKNVGEVSVPTHLLYAPRGLFDAAPGMLPEALVRQFEGQLTVEEVPDCNHYTILMGVAAVVVAQRLGD